MSTTNTEIFAVLAKKPYIKPQATALLKAFSTDYSAEHAAPLDTVKVLKLSGGTATDKKDGKEYEESGSSSFEVISLDHRPNRRQSFPDTMWERLSSEAHAALFTADAESVCAATESYINDAVAKVDDTMEFSATFEGLGTVQAKAVTLGIKDPVLALAPTQFAGLLTDSEFAKIAALNDSEAFRTGKIDSVAGMKIICLAKAPTGTVGFLASKSAIGIAARPTPVGNGDGVVIIDPESGLAFTHKVHFDDNLASNVSTTEMLVGVSVIDTDAVVKLTALQA